jgi:hypothetical protein
MNIRKRTSFSNGLGISDQSNILPQIALDNDANIRDENNHIIIQNSNLPSDQSEDEEMPLTNNNNNSTPDLPKPSGLASRSEVLSYFDQQPDEYKCKICTKVNLFVNTFPYEHLHIYKQQNSKDLDGIDSVF